MGEWGNHDTFQLSIANGSGAIAIKPPGGGGWGAPALLGRRGRTSPNYILVVL